MSEIDLLTVDDSELTGFSAEPADAGPSYDLDVTDGVSGLDSGVTLSDEEGAPEFGVDEADAGEDFTATRVEDVDDSDLLEDPEELPVDNGVADNQPDEIAGSDAEFTESIQRIDADLTEITGERDGSDHTASGEVVEPTGAAADVAAVHADPGDETAVTLANPDATEQTADDETGEDLADNEAAADEALGSGAPAATERQIGRIAAEAGTQYVIIDTGSRNESADSAADQSVATLERPHVGDRFGEVDQLRGRGQTAGERARLQQLEGLPHTGFTTSEIRQVRAQIAALGYPVDNFRQFIHKHNERGNENTIASWLGHGHGEFTVYDLYGRQIPEKRLGTLGHETAHANSPLKPENEAVFGGKDGQLEAARYIERVAQQSLETGVHLNGYHQYLMKEYKTTTDKLRVSLDSGELSDREHAAAQAEANRKYHEETWAIMNEMALTNRNGLAEVEARQFKALEDLARRRGEGNAPDRVALLSDPPSERDPQPQTYGIDRWLIHLIDGVNNQQELVQHVATLKQRFYGAANNEKATQRDRNQYAQAA